MKLKLKFTKPSKTAGINGKSKSKTSSATLFISLLFVISLSYLLYVPQRETEIDSKLGVGDIVKADIIIEKDITFEDIESTRQKRENAIAAVPPIYEFNPDNQTRSNNLVTEWFDFIKQARKNYIKNKNNEELNRIKEAIEKQFGLDISLDKLKEIMKSDVFNRLELDEILEFTGSMYEKRIIASRIGARKSPENTIKLVSRGTAPAILKIEDLSDLKDVEIALNKFLENKRFHANQREIISAILMEFIDANISYSDNLNQEEEARIAAAVNPVLIRLKAGKVILRKGDEVKPENLKIIKLIAAELKKREIRLPYLFLVMAILLTASLFGRMFFRIWESGSLNKKKQLLVIGVTLIVSAIIYRIFLFLLPLIVRNISILDFSYNMRSVYYAIPFGAGALIIAFTFTLQIAVIYSFINSIIGGIMCNWDFRIVLYILLGNLALCFAIEYFQRLKRSPIIKASIFWLLPVNIIFITLFNLTEFSLSIEFITANIILGTVSAILTMILASFIIPVWEILFKLITELKLIEIANLNLPIFREMLEKAPGTYHHSQMVASLAEATAPDLGVSPLLLTAMALYHDIGKIDNPHLFTENHTIYKNPHDNLSPRESAKSIIAHISDGVERANKIKLPEIVQSAIVQHHGNKLVRFFYEKAREMSSIDIDDFDETAFRYQGEKPQIIENAVIMLADQIEAASKSLASPTDEEIKNVIQEIIDANIEENQFDECEGLTFKALNIIAASFHQKLSSIYHMRVAYPGFDFSDKKENNKK